MAIFASRDGTTAEAVAKALSQRLEPLTASGNAWRGTALELTAALRLKSGDRTGALEIYRKLADDLSTAQGLRARAAEMSAVLAP